MTVTSGMFSSDSVEWGTPQELFDELDSVYHFTLDVCASRSNAKCERYFDKEANGLRQSWKGETCFMNPPYGKEIVDWVRKAYQESAAGATVVCLLPARTDTRWFHDYVYGKARIHFIKGRLKFTNQHSAAAESAPFPSMIAIYDRKLTPERE